MMLWLIVLVYLCFNGLLCAEFDYLVSLLAWFVVNVVYCGLPFSAGCWVALCLIILLLVGCLVLRCVWFLVVLVCCLI